MSSLYKFINIKRKNFSLIIVRTMLLVPLICALSLESSYGLSSQGNAYEFVPGDKLLVTVFGQKELSGEFTVDDQGNIQLPIGGLIPVEGATIQEIERLLKERLLAGGFLQSPVISVRVVERQPVFILGAVNKPGSFPFRFGITVAQVVALAGGFGKYEQRDKSMIPEFIAARERLAILKQKKRNLQIQLARIESQLAGSNSLILSTEIETDQNPSNQSMIKHAKADLIRLEKLHQRVLETIKRQQPRVEAEIAALRDHRKAAQRQVQLAKERFKLYENIRSKGLAKATTTLEIQNAIAQHEGTVARINARLSGLSRSLGELEIRLQRVINEKATRLTEEKENLLTRLREINLSLPHAANLASLTQSRIGVSVYTDRLPYKILLNQKRGANIKRTEVDLNHTLLPGDLIEVQIVLPQHNIDLMAASN